MGKPSYKLQKPVEDFFLLNIEHYLESKKER